MNIMPKLERAIFLFEQTTELEFEAVVEFVKDMLPLLNLKRRMAGVNTIGEVILKLISKFEKTMTSHPIPDTTVRVEYLDETETYFWDLSKEMELYTLHG